MKQISFSSPFSFGIRYMIDNLIQRIKGVPIYIRGTLSPFYIEINAIHVFKIKYPTPLNIYGTKFIKIFFN